MASVDRLALIGVGLIGGSFALALRRAGALGSVVGVGRSKANLQEALRLGIIDEIADTPEAAVENADLVLFAIPVGQMGPAMARIAPRLSPRAVVTDAGSTKQDVVALARQHLAQHLDRFVPGHPIAGSELTGATAARTELFDGRRTVLTPLPENSSDAVRHVTALWRLAGAAVNVMSPDEHDTVFAAVSHLPHLLAYTLVEGIARRPDADLMFGFAAGGFRDFTRIAGSSPEMWRDICLANRDALLAELDHYRERLDELRDMIARGDAAALNDMFSTARAARQAWLQSLESLPSDHGGQ